MEILLIRDVFGSDWTLGTLLVDGNPFGFTVEDQDRGLDADMPLQAIQDQKIDERTAIPIGRYPVLRNWSPTFKQEMMLVSDVPGYQGIRIHPGNSHGDTKGCILPGLRRDEEQGTVAQSAAACGWLDEAVSAVLAGGGEVWLTICRDGQ